jgi:4-hydroxybenzoate polyprenyltransferase
MAIFLVPAISQRINTNIFILSACCFCIYSAAGIHNSIQDKDFSVKKTGKTLMFLLVIIGIFLSLFNKIIFITSIAWIVLGLLYNTISRKILFGDATVLALTHYTIPCFSSSLILGIDPWKVSIYMFSTFWFIMQAKNIKDTKEDKERGYVTLTTVFSEGKRLSIAMTVIGYIMMFLSIPYFSLSDFFVFYYIFILLMQFISIDYIFQDQFHQAVKLIRLLMMMFIMGIIIEKSGSYIIVLSSVMILVPYLILLIIDQEKGVWIR